VLREAGLVEVRDAGRQRLYRLAPRRLQEIAEWAAGFSRFWERGLDRLGKQLGE
jgi:DNA-binding transcriptional ArsR family regulator